MREMADAKKQFNAIAKASMREFLRGKSWEEKVASVERIDQISRLAREGHAQAAGRRLLSGNRRDFIFQQAGG